MLSTQVDQSADKSKASKLIRCSQDGCKKVCADDDEASKDGWYLDRQGNWWCYQHNPNHRTIN